MRRVLVMAGVSVATAVGVFAAHAARVAALGAAPASPGVAPASRPTFIDGVASIIEADITSARYLYDDTDGPRTEYTLANVVLLRGQGFSGTSFTQFGGPMPNGAIPRVSHLPMVVPGARFILFIMGGPWFFTPIWDGMAFRLETIGNRLLVVAPDGTPVQHVGIQGVAGGSTRIVNYPSGRDPLLPVVRSETASPTAPDVVSGLDRKAFLDSVDVLLAQVGGLKTDPVSSHLSHDGRPWGAIPAAPHASSVEVRP